MTVTVDRDARTGLRRASDALPRASSEAATVGWRALAASLRRLGKGRAQRSVA
jgi:hypothetical protein